MGGAVSYASSSSSSSSHDDKRGTETEDWYNLPCPTKYEDITREAIMSLKPELFEGLRFDFTKPLNQKFSLSHSIFMGSVPHPTQSNIKVPVSHYEFGANLMDPLGKTQMVMLIGRILTDGRMSARIKYDVNDRFSFKINAQITNEPHFSLGMFHFDYRGNDYWAQLQMGNNAFYGVNYMQSVTNNLALGGEGYWLGHHRKSGIGFAARYNTEKVVATAQFKSGGTIGMTYVHKVSDKVSLASDFVYNWKTKEVVTSLGYDYLLQQCRLRGRLDTNGCIAAYLEERLNVGVNFLLSAEIDHWKKDYKFGFGMTVGQ
ncbi:unnamed protein product [Sphagnum troendelagicum]|uniref:Mitochondrial import receptor subunit TOM40-1 n=2 Tax=Sphagnum TaxID=13804 RepID=A0ABP0TZZ7_9BRYO